MENVKLSFFVNGNEVEVEDPDPEMTLLYFIRNHLSLTGSKLGCGEGGCGACTVMLSWCGSDGHVTHAAVNACLTPLCAVHGMAVTTVEGIGSTTTTLHPCQERIARAHGSQCGFCTPGFVMSMYALLRNNQTPSEQDIEEAFQGNLCRCTGYRPILDGYKTFAMQSDDKPCCSERDFKSRDIKSISQCCMNSQCCKKKDISCKEPVLFDKDSFIPLDSTQDPIFPAKLKLACTPSSLFFEGPRAQWFRPATLQELLMLRNKYPHIPGKGKPQHCIVMGNTEIGVEVKFKGAFYQTLIHCTAIPELNICELKDEGLLVGSAVTLSILACELSKLMDKLPSHKTGLYSAILEMLRWFAGQQIRNMATLGGNVCNASPISDLTPLLGAAAAKVLLASVDGSRSLEINSKFFSGYKCTAVKPNEVLVAILLPFTSKHEYIFGYKQSRRREDDIAIVNAGLRVQLQCKKDHWVVSDCTLCYGGMSYETSFATVTAELLKNKVWEKGLLDKAMSSLLQEYTLTSDVPGGMPEYRRSLVLSFFFKFFYSVNRQLPDITVDPSLLSLTEPYIHINSRSVQGFQTVAGPNFPANIVGQPLMHLSAPLQASGEACYTDDIPHLEKELHGGLVLSTHAHADISVDWSAIDQMNGVYGHVSAKDVPGSNITGLFEDEVVFADGKVTHFGQIIGVVLAKNQMQAQQAAKLVQVSYTDLPSVITIQDAITADSFFPEVKKVSKGDFTAAYADSPKKLEGSIHVGGQEHFYLEPFGCLAIPKGENREIEVFSSTQSVNNTQILVAKALGVPANRVIARVKRIGGGFGGKATRSCLLSTVTAVAAHKSQRPIRIIMDRNEDMLATGGRHPFLGKYKVGFSSEGMIRALDLELYSNAGISIDSTYGVNTRALFHADSVYSIPNINIRTIACKTNLPSNTAFRGFGSPQAQMIVEQIISRIAAHVNLAPEDVRLNNLCKEGDMTPYGMPLDAKTIRRCWLELQNSCSYHNRKHEIEEFNKRNCYKKRGIAQIPTKYGIAFVTVRSNQAGALLHVYTDGSVLLTHGGMEMGQGLHTKMVQVCSKLLNIPHEKIFIQETGSNLVPNSSSTAASSSTDLYGMAVKNCCEEILDRLAPVKEQFPEANWEVWIKEAYNQRINLSAQGFYLLPDLHMDWTTGKGNPFNYFTYGAAYSEVEVDTLTGDFTILRTDILMDVGDSINPAIDIGQVEGAFTQGVGLFTLEQCVYLEGNERTQRGELFTTGPGTYKLPSCKDIPLDFRVSLLGKAPNPKAIFSSKGIGEPPLFLAASVWFAIEDAVRASRVAVGHSSDFQLQTPATCERIRLACLDNLLEQVHATSNYADEAKTWTIEA